MAAGPIFTTPPPSPPLRPPIHLFALFSCLSLSLSLFAPRHLIIAGPHSRDLSPRELLDTNRSGLRRGGPWGREVHGMGLVARRKGGRGGDLEKNPPMMKYSVTQRKSSSNITARSRCPAVPPERIPLPAFPPSLCSPPLRCPPRCLCCPHVLSLWIASCLVAALPRWATRTEFQH